MMRGLRLAAALHCRWPQKFYSTKDTTTRLTCGRSAPCFSRWWRACMCLMPGPCRSSKKGWSAATGSGRSRLTSACRGWNSCNKHSSSMLKIASVGNKSRIIPTCHCRKPTSFHWISFMATGKPAPTAIRASLSIRGIRPNLKDTTLRLQRRWWSKLRRNFKRSSTLSCSSRVDRWMTSRWSIRNR